jgi:hypothetical protein
LGWLAEASDCISTFCFHLVVALLASSAFIILHSAFFGHWAGLIASGRADDFKEAALLPDFLAHIFGGLLGYTGPIGPTDPHTSHNSHNSHLSGPGPAESPDTFTFSRERHVEQDDKVPHCRPGPLREGQVHRRRGRQGRPRPAGPPVRRPAHVRRGPYGADPLRCPFHFVWNSIHHSSFILHPFRCRPPTVLAMGQDRQKTGKTLPIAALHQLWQDGAAMNESEKQFSFTRAAPGASGRAKKQFLTSRMRVS